MLLDLHQVAQAAVTTLEFEEGVVEIIAYYALKQGVEPPPSEISQALRSKLPVYMVPAFLEQVDAIPMTLSNKADYKKLPRPQLQRFSAAQGYVPPKTDRERILHAALTGVIRAEHISTEAHFFDDLGANSLLMARVCAAIRKNPGMSNVSMRDIYMHPTIARLAHHLDSSIDRFCRNEAGTLPRSVDPVVRHVRRPADWVLRGLSAVRTLDPPGRLFMGDRLRRRGGDLRAQRRLRRRNVCCADHGSRCGEMAADRPIQGAIDSNLEPCIFPLLGRHDPDAHIACGCLIGTPFYNVYLRLMGARIGRNVILRCQFTPVCTDLVTIGDNTIVRNETSLLGYRAQSNFIHMGPVAIGQQRIRRRRERARHRYCDG